MQHQHGQHKVVPVFSHLSWIVMIVEENVLVLGSSPNTCGLRLVISTVDYPVVHGYYQTCYRCKEWGFTFQHQKSRVGW